MTEKTQIPTPSPRGVSRWLGTLFGSILGAGLSLAVTFFILWTLHQPVRRAGIAATVGCLIVGAAGMVAVLLYEDV